MTTNKPRVTDRVVSVVSRKKVKDIQARREAETPKVWKIIGSISNIASSILGTGGIIGVAAPLLAVPGVNIPTAAIWAVIIAAGIFKGLHTVSKYQVQRH